MSKKTQSRDIEYEKPLQVWPPFLWMKMYHIGHSPCRVLQRLLHTSHLRDATRMFRFSSTMELGPHAFGKYSYDRLHHPVVVNPRSEGGTLTTLLRFRRSLSPSSTLRSSSKSTSRSPTGPSRICIEFPPTAMSSDANDHFVDKCGSSPIIYLVPMMNVSCQVDILKEFYERNLLTSDVFLIMTGMSVMNFELKSIIDVCMTAPPSWRSSTKSDMRRTETTS